MRSHEQKAHILLTGDASVFNIELVRQNKKYKEYVNDLIAHATSEYEEKYIASVLNAAKIIKEIEENETSNRELLDLKDKVSITLKDYKGPIVRWITNYLPDSYKELAKTSETLYDNLKNVQRYLKFENLVSIDKYNECLLGILWDQVNQVNTPQPDVSSFIDGCRACYSIQNETFQDTPDKISIKRRNILALIKSDDYKGAEKSISEFLEVYQDDSWALIKKGLVLKNLNDVSAALDAVQ